MGKVSSFSAELGFAFYFLQATKRKGDDPQRVVVTSLMVRGRPVGEAALEALLPLGVAPILPESLFIQQLGGGQCFTVLASLKRANHTMAQGNPS